MALVRCPKHKIPYNDANPRGCPACARESQGGGEADLMRELARMSRAVQQAPEDVESAPAERPPSRPSRVTSRGPVTEQPRRPAAEQSTIARLWYRARERRWLSGSMVLIVILGAMLAVSSGPKFVEQPHPPPITESRLRPLPIDPGQSIRNAFAVLGTQPPQTAPESRRLARYTYGSELTIDALNGVIYAITYGVSNRTWRGLRVGVTEREASGALALLGIPEASQPTGPRPRTVSGYAVYPSLDERPVRVLRTEVRPPNGCFDVEIELRPRVVGLLIGGGHRYAVVGQGDPSIEWYSTQVRVINRAVSGPFSEGRPACSTMP